MNNEELKARLEIAYEKSMVANSELKQLDDVVFAMDLMRQLHDMPESLVDGLAVIKEQVKAARSAQAHSLMHVQGIFWGQS